MARNVSTWTKKKVYLRYGMPTTKSGYCAIAGCKIDHLISLQLGGSNHITNLWPIAYRSDVNPKWNQRTKDRLENRLHRLVCTNKITMEEAQQEISSNWTEAYLKHIGEPK